MILWLVVTLVTCHTGYFLPLLFVIQGHLLPQLLVTRVTCYPRYLILWPPFTLVTCYHGKLLPNLLATLVSCYPGYWLPCHLLSRSVVNLLIFWPWSVVILVSSHHGTCYPDYFLPWLDVTLVVCYPCYLLHWSLVTLVIGYPGHLLPLWLATPVSCYSNYTSFHGYFLLGYFLQRLLVTFVLVV